VRRPSGFSILELVVVLLLMSILAATLIGRSVTSSDLDLNSATDKIRNQLRYAQAQAMKRANTTDPYWGIKSLGGQYWLFQGDNPDLAAKEVRVPGGDYPGAGNRINEADLGVTVSDFTVFFDRIGKPYSPNATAALANTLTITVAAGESRTITITPETGLIR
jgi:prepilin-type N-terminal cleavage/methylation domain-containing protein